MFGARLDVAWESGPQLREELWPWRHEIQRQIVNPDIDGILTACLLHHLKGWPVIGFYDTERLFLAPEADVPIDLHSTLWVDVDMSWPGARSLSQHVILDEVSDHLVVAAYKETVNPSLERRHARRSRYTTKYPFGTFQWAWWLSGIADLPDPDDRVMNGLAWMPDGGFQSVEGVWRANCLDWALRQMPGSILSPLAQRDPHLARSAVEGAEDELRRLSGVNEGWHNHQFVLPRPSAKRQFNPPVDAVPGLLQAVCDAVTEVYGWRKVTLPSSFVVVNGRWHTGAHPPPRWPMSANAGEIVSLAVTSKNQFCWTTPGDLIEVLTRTHAQG